MIHVQSRSTWRVESSHLVNGVPKYFELVTLEELRRQVQDLASRRDFGSPDKPPFGQLSYRYELDAEDQACEVHAYFTNRHGKRARFMKLIRDPQ